MPKNTPKKMYILHYEDRWEHDAEFVGVYSTRGLAENKVSERVENFIKHIKDKEKYRQEYIDLHEIEEVEVDK